MIFKNNYLTKKYMSNKYYNYNKDKIYSSKKNFVEFLKSIESEFYSHNFRIDNRYECVGRHRFLIDEMEQLYYTKEQCDLKHLDICPTVWCLDSLIELITQPNFLSLIDYEKLININDNYINKDINECRKIYDSYNQEDIISLNERDYILHALNMIKDSLKKCDDNLKWNN